MSKKKLHNALSLHVITLCSVLVVCMVFIGILIGYTGQTHSIIAQYQQVEPIIPTPTIQQYIPPAPTRITDAVTPPYLTARAAVAIDVESKNTLYAKEENVQLWPASTTKIMTALVAITEYKMNDIVTIHEPVSEGSVMGLVDGEQLSVENLLYGLLIQSANDAAFSLADHYPNGGRDMFVQKMNDMARVIGLERTHYVNPAGFDDDKQFTTASDMARLSLYALSFPSVRKIVSLPAITVPDSTYIHFYQLHNVNQLLGSVPGVAGIKTGWTENAKENLINLMVRDGHEIVTVILGSDDRFGETLALSEWAYANHTWSD